MEDLTVEDAERIYDDNDFIAVLADGDFAYVYLEDGVYRDQTGCSCYAGCEVKNIVAIRPARDFFIDMLTNHKVENVGNTK